MKAIPLSILLVFAVVVLALFDRPVTQSSPVATPVASLAPAPTPAPSPDEALRQRARAAGLQPLPPGPGPVRDNVLTPERIALGRQLYFDPRLFHP